MSELLGIGKRCTAANGLAKLVGERADELYILYPCESVGMLGFAGGDDVTSMYRWTSQPQL